MNLLFRIINMICAKLTIPLSILVIVIFILQRIGKKISKDHWINQWNRKLRKKHKPLGIALTAVAGVHGLFSSVGIFTLTWGTFSFVLLICIALSFYLRKKIGPSWMKWHRLLTIIFLGSLFMHFQELPGIQVLSQPH